MTQQYYYNRKGHGAVNVKGEVFPVFTDIHDTVNDLVHGVTGVMRDYFIVLVFQIIQSFIVGRKTLAFHPLDVK